MWNNDNNGGGGGGGFFQPNNGGGGMSQSYGGGGGGGGFGGGGTQGNRMGGQMGNDPALGAANRAKYHFHPVTMLMIKNGHSTPDDQFEVDGLLLQNVIVIGRVLQVEQEGMRTIIELSDNSESFKIIFYKKGENEDPKALKNFNVQENQWVKVMGTVRVFKEQTAIIGNQIMTIEDHNEIVNHHLQVFVAHNVRKKGVLSQDQLRENRARQVAGSGQPAANSSISLNDIMRSLMKRSDMRFIDKNSIQQECRGRMSNQEVDDQLQKLLSDGVIYTAMNENVFSFTEG